MHDADMRRVVVYRGLEVLNNYRVSPLFWLRIAYYMMKFFDPCILVSILIIILTTACALLAFHDQDS